MSQEPPEVVVHPSLREVAVGLVVGLAAAIFFFWLALDALQKRSLAALFYGLPALGFLALCWHVVSLRVVLRGEHFVFGGIRPRRGAARDFLGYDGSGTSDNPWRLLRREDLLVVKVPSLTSAECDEATARWLKRHVPYCSFFYRRQLGRARAMSGPAAVASLSRSLPPTDELPQDLDAELATAARAVALHGYLEAREPLERLATTLPATATAGQYVFDALGTVGSAASVEPLLRTFRRLGDAFLAGHAALALCMLAKREHEAELRQLAQDPRPFVSEHARAKLSALLPTEKARFPPVGSSS